MRLVAIMILLATTVRAPATERCVDADAEAAGRALEALQVKAESVSVKGYWKALHSVYEKYKECNDGSVGEAYAGVITVLLGRRWEHIEELEELRRKDPEFVTVVLKKFEYLNYESDVEAAAENAKAKCPKRATVLCKSIETATRRAMEIWSEEKRRYK